MELQRHILPYYMTYQGFPGVRNEERIIRDMEYLQQMYPAAVRKYQQRIAKLLDRMDYEGSMIYDEYPDRYSLERLSESVLQIIQQEERREGEGAAEKSQSEREASVNEDSVGSGILSESSEEEEVLLRQLVQVLLSDEVYKRRHGGRRGKIYFR